MCPFSHLYSMHIKKLTTYLLTITMDLLPISHIKSAANKVPADVSGAMHAAQILATDTH